jgi:AraC-like DNA-binding protein
MWHYSRLDDHCRHIQVTAGQQFIGVRLPPGAEIPSNLLADLRVDSADRAHQIVRQAFTLDQRVAEILAALSDGQNLRPHRCRLHLSQRSIQRLLAAKTGHGPLFWSRLARVRLAATRVANGQPLADCAADGAFADQAHMTREFVRWFGFTPLALRLRPDEHRMILTTGFAV